jgi:hypothetical protein
MPKFAPVAPIQVLEDLYDRGPQILGDYHLLLAHHTVDKHDRFRALFELVQEDGNLFPFVIMDNSLIELGNSVDFDMVRTAVNIIKDACPCATVVPVLPDVYGDGAATRAVIEADYPRWVHEMPGDAFMAVCQGNSHSDFTETLKLVVEPEFSRIQWLGIPRKLVEDVGTRKEAVKFAMAMKRPDQQVHLLGFSDNMQDDLESLHIVRGVTGIDSAVPLRVDIFDVESVPPPRPKDWFETAEVTDQMLANLRAARIAVRGE